MKPNWMKRTLNGLLAALLVLAAVPVTTLGANGEADVQTGRSPLAAYFDASRINPDYIEWMENGGEGLAPSANNLSYLGASYARLRSMQNSALLPKEYDLRDYGLVEPVSNQGQLGICWAIAINSAAASSIMDQFPQMSFSPIHTAWFTYRGDEEEEHFPTDDPYMVGGNDIRAVATMAAWKGPVFSDKAPMTPDDHKDPDESLRYEADYHLQDAYYMPNGIFYINDGRDLSVSNDITKQLIMDVGAVSRHFYSQEENNYNKETCAYYNSEDVEADHAVLLVGWDDDYPKENFCEGNQPQNDGAWLVRNSWGTDWGDDGYFWLSYEDKSVSYGNAYVLEEADNYANNYQYDTMGWSFSLGTSNDPDEAKTVKAANIFTAESAEMLEAVSFYTTDAGTNYTVSVYTGVGEGQPESGTAYKAVQTGTEPYAGYHTIELENPIALEEGERFSIVVELTNPKFDAPLAVEWYIKDSPDDIPEHMGSGGESYFYDAVVDTWADAAGSINDNFYVTNICIKGFTNPLPESGTAIPTVRFSKMEGPIADGMSIELTAGAADAIYYSIDGGAYQKYKAPLKMDFSEQKEHTVSAYAVTGGKQGNTVEKTYTKSAAQLTDLAVVTDNRLIHVDTKEFEHEVFVPYDTATVKVMAQSGDNIEVNGVLLPSSDRSGEISLKHGETNLAVVEAKSSGKDTTAYTLKIYRSMLDFDYAAETVKFDESKYTVKDAGGNEIKSGSSIKHLISDQEKTQVTVTPKDGGDSFPDYIPKRLVLTNIGIDYIHEQTDVDFSSTYAYSENADMSDKVPCQNIAAIPVEPGKDVYIQRQATDKDFAGNILHLEVPERPAAPTVEAEEITETSVTLKEIEGAMYSCNDGEWQEFPEFTDLTPGEEYLFKAYRPATETAFYSETGTANITTAIPVVDPSKYSFEVRYVDGEGNPVPGGGKITFDKAGSYSREDIPIPYGYIEIIPAHPGDDWLYPTALELIDGVWTITNPVVEIMVEPKATVNIIFKTLDGKVLEDLGYIEYFDSIGGGIETVTAPDGYEFIGGSTYAVEVTRGADGKLAADPTEVVFVVRAVGSGEPSEPDKPTAPTKPGEETTIPDTGDSNNIWLWMMLMISGGMILALMISKKEKFQLNK